MSRTTPLEGQSLVFFPPRIRFSNLQLQYTVNAWNQLQKRPTLWCVYTCLWIYIHIYIFATFNYIHRPKKKNHYITSLKQVWSQWFHSTYISIVELPTMKHIYRYVIQIWYKYGNATKHVAQCFLINTVAPKTCFVKYYWLLCYFQG